MDVLSSNSVLSRIFCYLEPRDVTSCLMVSRIFYSEIQRNWNKMKKKSTRLTIEKNPKAWFPVIPVGTHYSTQLEFLRDVIETLKTKFTIESVKLVCVGQRLDEDELQCVVELGKEVALFEFAMSGKYHLFKHLNFSRTKVRLTDKEVPVQEIMNLLEDWTSGELDILHIYMIVRVHPYAYFPSSFTDFCRSLNLCDYNEKYYGRAKTYFLTRTSGEILKFDAGNFNLRIMEVSQID